MLLLSKYCAHYTTFLKNPEIYKIIRHKSLHNVGKNWETLKFYSDYFGIDMLE